MTVTERMQADFARTHATRLVFDTSPRHLAGPGDARRVTHGLAAARWTRTSDPLSPEIVLRSPDYRYTVQFDPQSATSAWWRLTAERTINEEGWYAEFGALVPAEILSRLTDALVLPAPAENAVDPFQILRSAGWDIDSSRIAHSPDGMCHVHCPTEAGTGAWKASWRVDTCSPGHGTPMGPSIWHAYLPEPVPAHLVAVFITALVDPGPLQRGMYERLGHHSAVHVRSQVRPEQVVDAHSSRLRTIWSRARSASRQQATPVPSPVPSRRATHR
ncbi:uncharacterized protein DUF317 [Streptomyces sp. KhCrAH-43]|uniref:DUF317 domain-containing protein n=1 Tax=unclassified Streptomyces TaxID=2593676 RepID=UPI000370B4CB|nr:MULTISPECIES: DUF317 domain-containing protein [unclassified Streptomyces]MYS36691.1 DUF317 domain-containing protein [Streptomyces sp. SID4920]MYX69162.1 DUF317 domain-containing protein [Streptomyces sp. SID8373]RAJ62014.1 uncharacterized protein DUF317 [Streptomyces sp. KhCrAH-43]